MDKSLNTAQKYYFNGIICLFLFVALATGCVSDPVNTGQEDEGPEPIQSDAAKVSVLGVFHFGGSSGDLASMHMADPFGKRRQDDIKELVSQLEAFRPTKILVEYPKERQDRLQERFIKYLAREDSLTVNEIDQVGFRLAENLGLDQLYAIDYQLDLPGDGLVEYCQRHNKMSEFEDFIKNIQEYVAKENEALDTMRISAYLARTNNDSKDRETNEAYIGNTLNWGDSIDEAGANFAATWWKRNFVILKNIAGTIESKDDRILVIIGAGHRAVLKDLIIDRGDMEYVEVADYLK